MNEDLIVPSHDSPPPQTGLDASAVGGSRFGVPTWGRIAERKVSYRGDQKNLAACLERFGINPSEAVAGYGVILDRMYDELVSEVESVNEKVCWW